MAVPVPRGSYPKLSPTEIPKYYQQEIFKTCSSRLVTNWNVVTFAWALESKRRQNSSGNQAGSALANTFLLSYYSMFVRQLFGDQRKSASSAGRCCRLRLDPKWRRSFTFKACAQIAPFLLCQAYQTHHSHPAKANHACPPLFSFVPPRLGFGVKNENFNIPLFVMLLLKMA